MSVDRASLLLDTLRIRSCNPLEGLAFLVLGPGIGVCLAANFLRKNDFVARYGGEEFLLHFPDTGTERAFRVCDQLRLAVQDADWSDVAPECSVTISFGLAGIREGSRFTTILSEADMHLYRAKREGRNRVIAE